jgi:hypothetical protein
MSHNPASTACYRDSFTFTLPSHDAAQLNLLSQLHDKKRKGRGEEQIEIE